MKKSKKTAPKNKAKKAAKPAKAAAPKGLSGLIPLADKVLIKPMSEAEMGTRSPSGIILPDSLSEKTDRGLVVATGPGRWNEDGDERVPMTVSVGDKVLFQWGDKIEYGGIEYYLVSESNISAIIK